MLKKMLVSALISLSVTTCVSAQAELKADMDTLSGSVSAIQQGFFTNDKAFTLEALAKFQKDVKNILGDKHTITNLLPEKLRYKSSIAINSAEMIDKYINEIDDLLNDKNIRMIKRQMKTQKAFLNIQAQCFRCHNLVRDWE